MLDRAEGRVYLEVGKSIHSSYNVDSVSDADLGRECCDVENHFPGAVLLASSFRLRLRVVQSRRSAWNPSSGVVMARNCFEMTSCARHMSSAFCKSISLVPSNFFLVESCWIPRTIPRTTQNHFHYVPCIITPAIMDYHSSLVLVFLISSAPFFVFLLLVYPLSSCYD